MSERRLPSATASKVVTLSVMLLTLVGVVFILLQVGGGKRAAAQTVGDADCDSAVNSIDAVLVLQFDAGLLSSLPCPDDADVNRDGRVNSLDAALMLQFDAALVDSLPPAVTVTVSGQVLFDTGGPVVGAAVSVSAYEGNSASLEAGTLQGSTESTTTDSSGNFSAQVGPVVLSARVLVEVIYQADSAPAVRSAKWDEAESAALDMGTIVLPDAAGAEVSLTDGAGQTDDGSLRVEGLPDEVTSLFGRSYDPDEDPEAFPGEFAEGGAIPLNSSTFVWMEGLDAAGNPVDDLAQAATIRSQIDPSQWSDLEDLTEGTDRIEIPIYTYSEDTNMWEQQEGTGWLEDGQGTILPEDAQPVILDGSFTSELFATFTATHLSWMNVDYAFIGPWTLSRLDRDRRNDDCLFKALQLAKTIARSQQGLTTYQQFDPPGSTVANVAEELADGQGPELKNSDLNDAYGEFRGNEEGDRDDQFHINNSLWDGCGAGATEDQKKNTILIMTVTILHESAHWKWDTKHENGNWQNAEPGGEAGNELEDDLFGGIITDGDGIERDGNPLDNATRDGWLNPNNWPAPAGGGGQGAPETAGAPVASPLEVAISLARSNFALGEEIPLTVRYENVSSSPIDVLGLTSLEGYPLWFEMVREGETVRVPFRGTRAKRFIDWDQDFVTLQPGGTLERSFNFIRDAETGDRLYNLIRSGDYQLKAVYSGHWGLPQTESDAVSLTIQPGGSIAGTISDAETGNPIADATVMVTQDGDLFDTATSGTDGSYSIPELPAGTYTLEARAAGFLRNTRENVQVTANETTTVNFSLSPLLISGELRLVLTWGQDPRDLDSHLWLPPETPYHIAYFRGGSEEACPFARLDIDDTSSFGPETITMAQRFAGTYLYAVHRFSGIGTLSGSGAQVQAFDSTGLLATFTAPATGAGDWWQVLTIDGTTGAITEINQIGDDPAPYADTNAGCLDLLASRVGSQRPLSGVVDGGWAARLHALSLL